MYLRHSTIRKDGKTHTYWRLVRSVRRGRRVVQETVAQWGELDAEGRARARSLASQVSGEVAQQSAGHASLATTSGYVTTEQKHRMKAMRKFWQGGKAGA